MSKHPLLQSRCSSPLAKGDEMLTEVSPMDLHSSRVREHVRRSDFLREMVLKAHTFRQRDGPNSILKFKLHQENLETYRNAEKRQWRETVVSRERPQQKGLFKRLCQEPDSCVRKIKEAMRICHNIKINRDEGILVSDIRSALAFLTRSCSPTADPFDALLQQGKGRYGRDRLGFHLPLTSVAHTNTVEVQLVPPSWNCFIGQNRNRDEYKLTTASVCTVPCKRS
ncbi:hypothetical protein M514_00568 [Trichuris suis]|uniref:Uncharacterized protein n=1 Tax=Trichuris suis TaxID=68888 RepID=A0A085MSH5_9BILA|nr:hypothetical protein M513_00568 [Trichuris suis]KFD60171.1 hypothetical protein M514_00568 [Trichuris suis]